MSETPSFRAGGDVSPSRFVKLNASDDNQVLQCGANERPIGISQKHTKAFPIAGASGLAAADGDGLEVHGEGEVALLEYGGNVTRGDRLKSDADGKGVAVATSGPVQNAGAVALESGADGELHLVQVLIDTMPATATNV